MAVAVHSHEAQGGLQVQQSDQQVVLPPARSPGVRELLWGENSKLSSLAQFTALGWFQASPLAHARLTPLCQAS